MIKVDYGGRHLSEEAICRLMQSSSDDISLTPEEGLVIDGHQETIPDDCYSEKPVKVISWLSMILKELA